MAPEPLTYARAGGPPDDWCGLEIWNQQTGCQVLYVVEVDAAAGWVKHYVRGADGGFELTPDGEAILIKTIHGRFEIRRSAP